MKSILIPTDFSACASYAVDAGFQIAKRFNAKITLLHVMDLPENWETFSSAEKEAHPDTLQKWKNANILLNSIKNQYPESESKSILTGDLLAKKIDVLALKNDVDLIVMGSRGSSKSDVHFFGSNTQKVVRQVQFPVLIIKSPLKKVNFKNVVFASEFGAADKASFLKFKDIIKHFAPKLNLVSINSLFKIGLPRIIQKELMHDFEKLCSPLPYKSYIFKDISIEKGIRSLSDSIDADLIGISNHYRHPLKRLIIGSSVETLVMYSDLPVLTIDYTQQT